MEYADPVRAIVDTLNAINIPPGDFVMHDLAVPLLSCAASLVPRLAFPHILVFFFILVCDGEGPASK